MSVATHLVQ